ncbi:hypothetical protein QBC39DRAFT_68511 [Podospora conica]|nr:hypothetical protein QBC39DRAFT_68511 [Schizothecium conicum]
MPLPPSRISMSDVVLFFSLLSHHTAAFLAIPSPSLYSVATKQDDIIPRHLPSSLLPLNSTRLFDEHKHLPPRTCATKTTTNQPWTQRRRVADTTTPPAPNPRKHPPPISRHRHPPSPLPHTRNKQSPPTRGPQTLPSTKTNRAEFHHSSNNMGCMQSCLSGSASHRPATAASQAPRPSNNYSEKPPIAAIDGRRPPTAQLPGTHSARRGADWKGVDDGARKPSAQGSDLTVVGSEPDLGAMKAKEEDVDDDEREKRAREARRKAEAEEQERRDFFQFM